MTILVGNCPVNKLSWIASRLPPGMVKVLHTTLRMGNFAMPTSRAFAWAKNTDGLSFTFRTYNLHSKIRTLNAAPAAEDMRQNTIQFRLLKTIRIKTGRSQLTQPQLRPIT